MRTRLLNLLLIPAFLMVRMEWGVDFTSFVFEAVLAVFTGPGTIIGNLTHPIVGGGLIGLILLVWRVARPEASGWLTRVAVLILSPVPLIVLGTGLAGGRWVMVASSAPYVALAVMAWRDTHAKPSSRVN
jgi:hypothetical protein